MPAPELVPNAGSFFKNPIVSAQRLKSLKQEFPNIVYYPLSNTSNKETSNSVKLAAAWLIDHLGWKTRDEQGVVVHEHQALVLTNPQKRSGAVVLRYAYSIQAEVKKRFDVELEIEPRVVC